jgi:peptide/nickel transport system permease protein
VEGRRGTAVTHQGVGELTLATGQHRGHSWTQLHLNRSLVVGCVVLLTLGLIAALTPRLVAYDPFAQDFTIALQPPSLAHPFGTDNFGRDVFTRVLYGIRIDLQVGFVSVVPPFLVGVVLGSLAGYFGGRPDTVVMRLVDVIQAFPFLVLIIAVVAVLGPGLHNMYIAVAIVGWIVYARLVRSEMMVAKNQEYVLAAKTAGNSDTRIIWRHLLPNVITSSIVYAAADIALYILLAAALSFLGLGASPPTPEWGAMITEGQSYMTTAWWMSALPGLAIVVTGVALSLVGDGLSDALRPVRG